MSGNIFNKLIDFRVGTKDEYDEILESGRISEEDIYYVTQDVDYNEQTTPMVNMFVGTDLIGDTYNSQYLGNLTKRVTNPIGLIEYGTTLGSLINRTGGSLSRVVDLMLFTERQPSIDECAVIAGFIPSVDVSSQWSNQTRLEQWISDYASPLFTQNRYDMFFDLPGEISTLFTIDLDPTKSSEEYNGQDTGIYTGRMFVAIPRNEEGTSREISTIVDKVFSRVYTGDGLTQNYLKMSTATLEFRGQSYPYTIYLFGETQTVISRIDMEYAVTIS